MREHRHINTDIQIYLYKHIYNKIISKSLSLSLSLTRTHEHTHTHFLNVSLLALQMRTIWVDVLKKKSLLP